MAAVLALIPEATDPVIPVPADLDDVASLLEFRRAVESALVRRDGCEGDAVVLDCQNLRVISTPVLGWLAQTIRRSSERGVQLHLHQLSPVVRRRLMQLMQLP